MITMVVHRMDVQYIAHSATETMAILLHREWERSIPCLFVIILSCFPEALSNDQIIDDSRSDFTCKSGTVIPAKFVCDGELDCGLGDGSDEKDCVEYQTRDDELSEELFGTEEITQKLDQTVPVEDETSDDKMHDDVSAIGKSWYKRS